MGKSWDLLRNKIMNLKDEYGEVAEFCRKIGKSRTAVDKWIKMNRSPKISDIDQIALGLNETAWRAIQPEEDKSFIEKLIPFDIIDQLLKLSPEKRDEFFATLRSMLKLAGAENCEPNKKKYSGL